MYELNNKMMRSFVFLEGMSLQLTTMEIRVVLKVKLWEDGNQ